MSHDIFLTNKDNLVHWLDRYLTEVYRLRDLIEASEPESLYRALAEAALERQEFIQNPPTRKESLPDTELPSIAESLLGSMALNRAKELSGELEKRQKEREREDRLRRRDG